MLSLFENNISLNAWTFIRVNRLRQSRLTAQVLFGLIGSKTKRMLFEHRLQGRGVTNERLNKMVCPIGLPGIQGKEPAVIAASVTAQLLQVWQAAQQKSQPSKSSTQQMDVPEKCH